MHLQTTRNIYVCLFCETAFLGRNISLHLPLQLTLYICRLPSSTKARVGNPGKASKSRIHFENMQPTHLPLSHRPSRQSYAAKTPSRTQRLLEDNFSVTRSLTSDYRLCCSGVCFSDVHWAHGQGAHRQEG